ncbi:hypothetical protein Sphch_2404 [Sphingobium chlorophenolicum L-1]|uniref:Uncharacterized protein n=1 Tax=Sphingobium chlorophenolicum L-1 TaxID=690566 RepID=F6EYB2_SPHCR|nr:hypothetical protein Sphch_2404 [Sphingobium chlorophenolicum L-1]
MVNIDGSFLMGVAAILTSLAALVKAVGVWKR